MSENGGYVEKEALRKLFVGGLDRNTTDETFRQHFEEFGTIVDLVIIRDKNTQESKGFGFVTYDSSLAVKGALDNRPHVIDDRTVEVKRAIPREDNTMTAHQRTKKLFVGGLPSNIKEEDLIDYLNSAYEGHGVVEKCELIRNKETNEVRGFGFVELSNEDMADVVIISEPRPVVAGKKIEIKKCEERGAGGGGSPGGGRGRGRGGGRGGSRGGYGGDRGSNQAGGGYWGGVGGNAGGGGMYGGYGQGGMYGGSGYGQDYTAAFNSYGNYGGGYGGGYDQAAYSQQGNFGAAGGRGGRGGGRYRPY